MCFYLRWVGYLMIVPMEDPFVNTMGCPLGMMAWDYALGMTVEDMLGMMAWDYASGMTVEDMLVVTMMVAALVNTMVYYALVNTPVDYALVAEA